ncbi:rhomboid family intramembrane serine protease [Pseudalkalibacillus caeni]|uniref:Rhomboid family intramembrane serine protease n=1 Tax=Exobacillus caeni TaxID=2574798 RepID=A0A5R9EUM9_9BACL|nr:rhomboid family intramembrane serine protease [Pseudalkalibacillus caeni]TLS34902.1 rhomboid family intramembrane serine protease [Pseudalkalibacillus caeni]
MFIRNEDFRSFLRYYPLVSILIAINLLLFVLIYLLGFQSLLQLGVGQNGLIARGEYWRLVTPIFLHGGFAHVLFNSFSLYLFGPALEQMLGKVKFLVGYFGAGLIANVAAFYLEDPYFSHVGASGAIFGLFGIYLYMAINRKELIDQANSQLILTILGIGLIMTFISPNINILGHLFGLIGGAVLAPLLLVGAKRFYSRPTVYARRTNPDEVSFNPNRWKYRRRVPPVVKKILWGFFIVLVIAGFLLR